MHRERRSQRKCVFGDLTVREVEQTVWVSAADDDLVGGAVAAQAGLVGDLQALFQVFQLRLGVGVEERNGGHCLGSGLANFGLWGRAGSRFIDQLWLLFSQFLIKFSSTET